MKWSMLFITVITTHCFAQTADMLQTSLDTLFSAYFKPGEPGGAVLLVKNDRVIYQAGFGIADTRTREPISTQTRFNIGSISKTFVAYGILKLESEKKLSLHDDLFMYFPDFKKKKLAQQVKLYHLLTHTSGLPDNRKVKEQHDFYLVAKDEENFAPLKQTVKLEFEPGTKYHYSNPAFNGLALIIERITGKKWQDYISQEIFQPAGMGSSTITDGPHPETGVAHAYKKNQQAEWEELDYGEEPTFAAAGNGGVWSSVEELWKYEQAIRRFAFLDSTRIAQSRTVYSLPEWKGPAVAELGLSWFINNQPPGVSMTGHTGSQGGFISDYCWLPGQKVFYVLLCNTPKPIKENRGKLFSFLQQHNWLNDQP